MLELDAEVRQLQREIKTEKDPLIGRLEKEAKDYKEQTKILDGLVEHFKNQLEQVGRDNHVDVDWLHKSNEDLQQALMGSLQSNQNFEDKIVQMESVNLELQVRRRAD